MALRYVFRAMTAIVFTGGLVTTAPAHAQLRDGGLLPPEESGNVTVMGCFLRGEDGKKYVLAHPSRGPVNSVREESCTAGAGDNALVLDNARDYGMNDSMLGRWIEISGRLEKETSDDPDNLRELDVRSFRILPVVPPRVSTIPSPAPEPFAPPFEQPPIEQPRAPEPAPVATTGQAPASLPQTASFLPASGLIGLLLLAGGLVLRSYRSR